MALAESVVHQAAGDVPVDRFGVRLAMILAMRGWNYEQLAEATGINAENLRRWAKTPGQPRNYEDICRQIADGTGFDKAWIAAGGPLRSRWSASAGNLSAVPTPPDQQMEFALDGGVIDLRDSTLEQHRVLAS